MPVADCTQPGDVGEQMTTGSIEVDAYLVDTVLNRLVERFLQLRLVYIMLVLTYTNGFGVDFYQFRQRVHQAAGNGYGAADGDIIIGNSSRAILEAE